ncbi:retrotransposon protein, putative, ty1-copia subclass [Tanacetum coccineum]
MTTLVEFMIVVGAENRPPMLDKAMYNSWESRMFLYIKGKKNGFRSAGVHEDGGMFAKLNALCAHEACSKCLIHRQDDGAVECLGSVSMHKTTMNANSTYMPCVDLCADSSSELSANMMAQLGIALYIASRELLELASEVHGIKRSLNVSGTLVDLLPNGKINPTGLHSTHSGLIMKRHSSVAQTFAILLPMAWHGLTSGKWWSFLNGNATIFTFLNSSSESDDSLCAFEVSKEHELRDLDEPDNYKTALLDPKSDKLLNAMNVEMQSMKDNKVWELVDLPPNGKTVGHKWLFKKKTDIDGAIHTYKARLTLAIAMFYDNEIWKMDFKTAFLNGYLNEEVYIKHLKGFVNQKFPNRVCKLKRSIYGFKQASRQWNKQFDDEIKKFGFSQNRDEPCVYVKASGSYVTFLILYVDDILIMGNNIPMLQDVKSYLGRCFAMKDLGKPAYILGIKIYRDKSKRLIGLCQSAYIEKILKRFYRENSKRGTIPIQEKLKLNKSQSASTPAEIQRMQNIPYASVVGSIMYDMRCTRPDVAFVQNMTSQFQQNLGELYWTMIRSKSIQVIINYNRKLPSYP